VVDLLEARSATKGDVADECSEDDGEYYEDVGPPGTEGGGETVSELLKDVVIDPTKEAAKHESQGVPDPREETAQGMWQVARLRLEGWMIQDARRFVAKSGGAIRGQRRLTFRSGWGRGNLPGTVTGRALDTGKAGTLIRRPRTGDARGDFHVPGQDLEIETLFAHSHVNGQYDQDGRGERGDEDEGDDPLDRTKEYGQTAVGV
jgi:hypothetical protein